MRIACPGCKAEFNIEDGRIPAGGLHLKCPKCAALFAVKKDGGPRSSPPPADAAVPLPGAGGLAPPPPGGFGAVTPPAGPPPGAQTYVPASTPAAATAVIRPPFAPPPAGAPVPLPPVPGPVAAPPPAFPGRTPTGIPAPVWPPPPPGGAPDPLDEIDLGLTPPGIAPPPPDFGEVDFEGRPTVVLPKPRVPAAGDAFDPVLDSPPPATDGGLEFDPTTTPGPRTPSPAMPPPPAPAAAEADLELLDFIEGAATAPPPVPAAPAAAGAVPVRYTIRRKSGKTFGPFEAHTIERMLGEGQLLGNEEVSADGVNFAPIGSVPAFAAAIEGLMEAPGGLVRGLPEGGPPQLFDGRMAGPDAMHARNRIRDVVSAAVAGLRERLPENLQHRLPLLGGAAGVVLLLVVGLVLELATPYGFWFRRPIFGLSGPDEKVARLLDQAESFLEQDQFGAGRRALEFAETALKAEPEDAHAQAVYAQAVYALERRYGGHTSQLDRARGFLERLEPAGSREAEVLVALAGRALLEKNPARATELLDEALGREPEHREALALAAEAKLAAKDAAGAIAHAEKLLALEPGSARALHLLGLARLGAEPEAALAQFQKALATDPRHASSAVELAAWHLGQNELEAAAGFVGRALSPEGIEGLGGTELARAWAIEGTLKARRHQPAEAQKAFEAAMQASTGSGLARLHFGRFLTERRQFDKAVEILKPAYEASPSDLDLATALALAQIGAGRYLEASRIADALVGARNGGPRALFLQGRIQQLTGKEKEAEKTWAAAAEKDPKFAAPLVALGRMHLAAGNLEAARADLAGAAERAPGDVEVQTALGEAALAEGKHDEALGAFERALALDVDHAPARVGKARVLEARGDLAAARAEIEAAVAVNDVVAENRNLLAGVLWRIAEADGKVDPGELDRALAEADAAAKLDPKNVRYLVDLGAIQLRSGAAEAAVATLVDATGVDALDAEAHLWLARAALARGDLRQALDSARSAIRIDDENPAYHYQHGRILEAGGNPVDALDAFKEAVRLAPADADALEHLGKNQTAMNALADAVRSYEAAFAADPERTGLLLLVGEVHLKAGQWDRAIAKLSAALKRDPSLVGAHARLGQAYDEKGDRKNAVAQYRLALKHDPENPIPYRQLGFAAKERYQNGEAIAMFRKYLELKPEAEDKADIEEEIATLLVER